MRRTATALTGLAVCLLVLSMGTVSATTDPTVPEDVPPASLPGDPDPDDPDPDDTGPDEPDPDTEPGDGVAPPSRTPLVLVPTGCLQPELPDVVFVGTVIDRDFRTSRFEILQVRAGDAEPFAIDGIIDVRYGLDVQFTEPGDDYLVSARRDPVLGVLASRVSEPAPDFGGDDVIGLAETDVACPVFADDIRTIHPDGTEIETSVLAPIFERRGPLFAALVIPIGIAFGVVFVLAMLRLGISGMIRGISAAVRRPR